MLLVLGGGSGGGASIQAIEKFIVGTKRNILIRYLDTYYTTDEL